MNPGEAPPGPLGPGDLQLIESPPLPALERHHLRLLAHCLRCLQQIAGGRSGPVPPITAIEAWMADQPQIQGDPGFGPVLLVQLQNGAAQLESLAAELGCDPLALDLPQLITRAQAQAEPDPG
ncbi:MAG: hypothetical protein WCK64_13800 [Synechococcaceae cyanobacterium ELA445]